jgi:hypothetical protein
MPYDMHRIFCATPGDLEDERQAFYQIMSEVNEAQAMQRDVLLVSVSITPSMADMRPFQPAIKENIQACRYYIQLLEDTWGAPQKNFEREYALARKYSADPGLPMKEVAVLFKKPLLPHKVEAEITDLKQTLRADGNSLLEFDGPDEFKAILRPLLERWLETIAPAEK